ncbi:MAG: recombinase family protein [Lachnospiraceae bacterium]|nr:recombinase family protein [Lachnospiraceae bacterium]
MKGNYYGYIRVSTKEQHEDHQVIALEAFGVSRKNIYMDKWSGKDFERPKYRALMKKMRPGDVLAVKSIDRLGRNYAEIQNQWRMITKEMWADIVVLDMPLLDTRKKDKDLTGTLAKEKGVRFGRESMEIPLEFYPLQKEYKKGMISARTAAKKLGVAHSTFLKWHRMMQEV